MSKFIKGINLYLYHSRNTRGNIQPSYRGPWKTKGKGNPEREINLKISHPVKKNDNNKIMFNNYFSFTLFNGYKKL